MLSELAIKGSVEAILEDEQGNIIYREKVDNQITDVFRKIMLWFGFTSSAALSAVTGHVATSPGTHIHLEGLATVGLYCLNQDINVSRGTFKAPYFDNNYNYLTSNVTFYNIDGNATQSTTTMIPNHATCGFDPDTAEMVIEFRKTTGTGTVKSLCIGLAHLAGKGFPMFRHQYRDTNIPAATFLDANFILQHTKDSTTVYRRGTASNTVYAFNFNTRILTPITNTTNRNALLTNLPSYNCGIVIKDTIFRVSRYTYDTRSYSININYCKNWLTATTGADKVLEIPIPSDHPNITTETGFQPLYVHNTDTDMLEVFFSLPPRNVGSDVIMYRIMKVIIDPITLQETVYDMGDRPSAIAQNFLEYQSGLYYAEKYWLSNYIYSNTSLVGIEKWGDYRIGSVFDKNLQIAGDDFMSYGGALLQQVITSKGVKSIIMDAYTDLPYQDSSMMISGVNFSKPIVKGASNMLRIIYRYKLT